ncbi:MAG: FtsX-like permease family protein [Burkholderiaceae bacterium]|nr:FtsX-like permease family protein [Burkholderiaceae bacterium]
MIATLRLSTRNLMRYRRRTLLTAGLITIGVVAMLLFVSAAGSFKNVMIGQITDSLLGHLQVHRRGYVASVDNLPLNLNIGAKLVDRIKAELAGEPAIAATSVRLKMGAMFSNYSETTSIRLNGVDPAAEDATAPGLRTRITDGARDGALVAPGQLLIPELIARGMKVKVGDTVVLVATNRDGSVNGKNFTVRGVLEPITGPGGRDGYLHQDDARELLRMDEPEAMEIAVRLHDLGKLEAVQASLAAKLDRLLNKEGKPMLELHSWKQLSPFTNIANMIDLMTLFIRVMLVAIVLVSVMNVMLMAVYERIREIGTLAAIGTPPRRILGLYVGEGLLLGLLGAAIGVALSLGVVALLNFWPLQFPFGRQVITLQPTISVAEVTTVALLVIGMAVLASLQPAWRASRMDPIVALRHV